MQKFASLFALLFLAACVAPQTALTEPSPPLALTAAPSATATVYAPLTASPTLPPPVATPLPIPTETPISVEPTPPPLIAYVQIDALTLFDENSGWALQSFYTPSATEYRYDVERKVIRTTEGLQGWKDVSPPPDQEMNELVSMVFLDANTAVGFFYRNFLPLQADTELTGVRTVDGGRTWQVGETMHFTCCMRTPRQITMLDANLGWMYAEDDGSMGIASLAFFRTSDGGLHWDKVYDSNDQFNIDSQNTLFAGSSPFGSAGFALIDFNTAVYAVGRLYRSEDGGKSWQQSSVPIPPANSDLDTQAGMGNLEPYVTIPQFWTKKDGVLVGRYYTSLQIPPGIPTSLADAEFLYYTRDGGKSWTFRRSPARTGSVYFLDSNTGWYLGKSDPDPTTPTQFYQTTDGGQTWTKLMADCPLPLSSEIRFLDAYTGYAFKTRSTYDSNFDARATLKPSDFLFTRDGGRSWEQVELEIAP